MRLLSITKPGIIFGNCVTVCGGFFLGSPDHLAGWTLLFTLIGLSLIVASGCVLNNCIDRDIDQLMERTCDRVMVKGLLSLKVAVVYALFAGVIGCLILYFFVNTLALLMALVGLVFYVGVYTLCLKRRSVYGTLIGGISGAMPPVVGYCAATNRLDLGALLVFLILFFWQMPHFYAIAIYRLKDFKNADIPVLPLKKSMRYTQVSMLVYIGLFTVAAILPALFGYLGIIYFVVALALGVIWFVMGLRNLNESDSTAWARKLFLFSILVITLLSLTMMVKL